MDPFEYAIRTPVDGPPRLKHTRSFGETICFDTVGKRWKI
jgi:hypothetical protein